MFVLVVLTIQTLPRVLVTQSLSTAQPQLPEALQTRPLVLDAQSVSVKHWMHSFWVVSQ
jgi:hypothetical protein